MESQTKLPALIRGNIASRTSWASVALILLGSIQQTFPQFVDVIPDRYEGIALAVIGAAMLLLRNITTQPIAERGAAE